MNEKKEDEKAKQVFLQAVSEVIDRLKDTLDEFDNPVITRAITQAVRNEDDEILFFIEGQLKVIDPANTLFLGLVEKFKLKTETKIV